MTDRLFLALWPPNGVLDELQRALPRDAKALHWQPRERWHITVAFLGDRQLDRELRRLGRLRPPSPESVRLQGSGTFGPVLWVGVGTGTWLSTLAGQTRDLFHVDERRFRGHVTVARARDAVGHRELRRAREQLKEFASSSWLPEELTLVRSVTGSRPSYEVMGRCGLRAP